VDGAHPRGDSRWTRPRSRRDVLRLGAGIAAGGAVARLLAACAAPTARRAASVAPSGVGTPAPAVAATTPSLSGRITVLAGGGDPSSEPALKQVYDDFRALNPGIEWDIRALPGLGPEWIGSRAARWSRASRWGSSSSMACSSERGRAMACSRTWALTRGWPTCSRGCRRGSTWGVPGRPPHEPSPLPSAEASRPRASMSTRRCSIRRASRLPGPSPISRPW